MPLEPFISRVAHPLLGGVVLVALVIVAAACSGTADGGQAVAGQLVAPTALTSTTIATSSGGEMSASASGEVGGPPTTTPLPLPAAPKSDSNTGETGPAGRVDTAGQTTMTSSPTSPTPTRPDWLGSRVLTTNAAGVAEAQPTPPELLDRRFPTIDTLPPPASDSFQSSVEPLTAGPLARSTWGEECPVGVDELRYLKISFWGFDQRPHQGELIVNAAVADDIVDVFKTLYEAQYPIEEMRIATQADLDAPPTGDGNNTTAFVCRAVTGGSRFSEHAYGLAIDINPFLNPYQRGDVVLPELATAYLDRTQHQDGVITEGGVVVQAFDAIGWGWGGRWKSLKDYQHFALNNR